MEPGNRGYTHFQSGDRLRRVLGDITNSQEVRIPTSAFIPMPINRHRIYTAEERARNPNPVIITNPARNNRGTRNSRFPHQRPRDDLAVIINARDSIAESMEQFRDNFLLQEAARNLVTALEEAGATIRANPNSLEEEEEEVEEEVEELETESELEIEENEENEDPVREEIISSENRQRGEVLMPHLTRQRNNVDTTEPISVRRLVSARGTRGEILSRPTRIQLVDPATFDEGFEIFE